jgi:hypothetical protein
MKIYVNDINNPDTVVYYLSTVNNLPFDELAVDVEKARAAMYELHIGHLVSQLFGTAGFDYGEPMYLYVLSGNYTQSTSFDYAANGIVESTVAAFVGVDDILAYGHEVNESFKVLDYNGTIGSNIVFTADKDKQLIQFKSSNIEKRDKQVTKRGIDSINYRDDPRFSIPDNQEGADEKIFALNAKAAPGEAVVSVTARGNQSAGGSGFTKNFTVSVNAAPAKISIIKGDDGIRHVHIEDENNDTASVKYFISTSELTKAELIAKDSVEDMISVDEGADIDKIFNDNSSLEYGQILYFYTVPKTAGLKYAADSCETFRVGKKVIPNTDITAPSAKTLEFSGSAMELINAGSVKNDIGTMRYALGTATEATEEYTTSIPTATDAGTYYVWYKVVGDDNHNDSAPAYVQVTIAAKQEEETGKAAAEKDEADKAAAETVTTLINSLSNASGKEAVAEVRAKYEALTNEQKALVSADTKTKLENAEKAVEVADAINSLTDASTGADVEAVRAKYDALTEDQKKYVSNETVAKLESAERAVAAAADKPVPGTYQVSNGVYTVTEDGRAIYEKPVKAKSKLKVLDTVNVPTVGGGTTAVPVKEIREKAFSSAKKMTQLTIGKNVEIIGKKACEKCTKLTKVIGGVAVKEIRDGAFASCTELETLPSFDKLVKVGEKAFYKVKELTKFTFGKFVSKIGAKAFYACESLKTLKFKGTCELSVGSKAFDKIHSDAKATIKKAVKKEYTKELKKSKLKKSQIKAK